MQNLIDHDPIELSSIGLLTARIQLVLNVNANHLSCNQMLTVDVILMRSARTDPSGTYYAVSELRLLPEL